MTSSKNIENFIHKNQHENMSKNQFTFLQHFSMDVILWSVTCGTSMMSGVKI